MTSPDRSRDRGLARPGCRSTRPRGRCRSTCTTMDNHRRHDPGRPTTNMGAPSRRRSRLGIATRRRVDRRSRQRPARTAVVPGDVPGSSAPSSGSAGDHVRHDHARGTYIGGVRSRLVGRICRSACIENVNIRTSSASPHVDRLRAMSASAIWCRRRRSRSRTGTPASATITSIQLSQAVTGLTLDAPTGSTVLGGRLRDDRHARAVEPRNRPRSRRRRPS